MTGAIHHYRAALRLEPDYPGGVDLLRIPSCYLKYHLSGGEISQPPKPSHCSRGNSLTNIQVRTPSSLSLSLIILFLFKLLRSVGPELSAVSRRAVVTREVVVVIPVTSRTILNTLTRSRFLSLPLHPH